AAGAGRAADYWTLTIALNPPGAGGGAPLPPVARGVRAPGVEGGERRELSPLLEDGDRQETEDPERVAVSEALANFLWAPGALGVVEETLTEGSALRAYFAPGVAAAALADRVREYVRELGALGAAVDPAGVSVAPLIAEAWAEAWRAHFRPLAVGRRGCGSPPWGAPPAGPGAGPRGGRVEPGAAVRARGHPTHRG